MRRLSVVLALFVLIGCDEDAGDDIFAAIRSEDVAGVARELAKGVDLEPVCPSTRNCKPLGYAAAFGNIEIIKLLIEAGADPDGIGAYGDVPLIKAANGGAMAGRSAAEIFAIQAYLMEKGADLNIPNRYGLSAFTGFCMFAEFEKMELALKHGADVNGAYETRRIAKPPTTASILMHVISRGEAEVVSWLIVHGADVNYANPDGETALSRAQDAENEEIIRILQGAGAS